MPTDTDPDDDVAALVLADRGGDQVGTVRFDPYDYDYSGDRAAVDDVLSGAGDWTAPDTGDPTGGLTPERRAPLPPAVRKRLLRVELGVFDGLDVTEQGGSAP